MSKTVYDLCVLAELDMTENQAKKLKSMRVRTDRGPGTRPGLGITEEYVPNFVEVVYGPKQSELHKGAIVVWSATEPSTITRVHHIYKNGFMKSGMMMY